MTSPQLEAYRAAYAAHSKLREDYDALCTTVAEAMRATAAELTPAAKRKNLIPVDGVQSEAFHRRLFFQP